MNRINDLSRVGDLATVHFFWQTISISPVGIQMLIFSKPGLLISPCFADSGLLEHWLNRLPILAIEKRTRLERILMSL